MFKYIHAYWKHRFVNKAWVTSVIQFIIRLLDFIGRIVRKPGNGAFLNSSQASVNTKFEEKFASSHSPKNSPNNMVEEEEEMMTMS